MVCAYYNTVWDTVVISRGQLVSVEEQSLGRNVVLSPVAYPFFNETTVVAASLFTVRCSSFEEKWCLLRSKLSEEMLSFFEGMWSCQEFFQLPWRTLSLLLIAISILSIVFLLRSCLLCRIYNKSRTRRRSTLGSHIWSRRRVFGGMQVFQENLILHMPCTV